LSLDNFPDEALGYMLFDLAAHKAVREGTLQRKLDVEIPEKGDHFFLLVRPRDTR
jgi:hypothetical protein